MGNYDLSPLFRQWIGFDKLASSIQGNADAGFPPYNIEKGDDNHYRITLALAGFKQDNLTVESEGQRLTVRGNPTQIEKEIQYLHQGLACKAFELSFTLADHMSVTEAKFELGLLHIDIVRQVPESLQAQRIAIGKQGALEQ
ncbi:small heat shock chaperone IbpB [Pragia fontium]|nr:small heat shock chaperone IbpB [Pragia fontium]AKJ40754.1 hypothetical protein QQ39_00600 [Pragia fontium]GKX63679.1 heat-shock protein IbpB [Pragia fontium]SUB80921.1 16 kDa heat shock protein B [Pragia fontium]VEJ52735.1 16 kDa heat shock protein B [Pragia fontium]